jgi:uncharacterized membrane protein
MMMNIILAACFVPIWPVMYFTSRNFVKPKKNIILGATLPQEVHDKTEVQAVCYSFKSWLNILMLPLLPLLIPPFLMRGTGAPMTWYMTWLLLLIVAPFAVFGVHRGKLIALKRDNGWYSDAAGQALVDVDATAIPVQRIGGIWFLLPVVIGFIPVAGSASNSGESGLTWVYVTFALIIVLFWLLYHMIFRVRAEVVNENMTLTMALTRVRRYNWGKFWLISVWLTCALNLLIWFFADNVTVFLVATLTYSAILLIAAVYVEFATRIAQQNLTASDVGKAYLDEDDYWVWGMFYHNPDDSHFLVNARVGMNMSVNLAKPGAKVLMLISALLILAMPFIGIWIWAEEVTPTTLVLTDSELVARHMRNQYIIKLDDIDSVALLDELPVIISRVAGSSFEHMAKGRFSVQGHGITSLCIQRNEPPFLMVVANGRTYLLNDADSSVTEEVYRRVAFLVGD